MPDAELLPPRGLGQWMAACASWDRNHSSRGTHPPSFGLEHPCPPSTSSPGTQPLQNAGSRSWVLPLER